ncbi:hypothetical protein [Streptomyces sp. MMBL 11-3]|uniref:hypothetical protein n=1 Tax=Streptomyces sp. MMBL 11-3 TaxID=3382639 RepID=UPI0039B385A8
MENLSLHELGLLRGAAEGHDTRYFGSLFALDHHAYRLLGAHLIAEVEAGARRDDNCQFYEATAAGRAFCAAHLSGLEAGAGGRANAWHEHPQLAAAARALGRLLEEAEHPAGPAAASGAIG